MVMNYTQFVFVCFCFCFLLFFFCLYPRKITSCSSPPIFNFSSPSSKPAPPEVDRPRLRVRANAGPRDAVMRPRMTGCDGGWDGEGEGRARGWIVKVTAWRLFLADRTKASVRGPATAVRPHWNAPRRDPRRSLSLSKVPGRCTKKREERKGRCLFTI